MDFGASTLPRKKPEQTRQLNNDAEIIDEDEIDYATPLSKFVGNVDKVKSKVFIQRRMHSYLMSPLRTFISGKHIL